MSRLFLIVEAYVRLIAHDVFMFRHDLNSLHQQIKSFPLRAPRRKTTTPKTVGRALDIACSFYPKQPLCLQRSTVLVKMLRRRGAPARLVIGARKLPFKAHAWVEVNGTIVNDRLVERENFLVLEVC